MEFVSAKSLKSYLLNDQTSSLMDSIGSAADEALTCQRWLRDSPAKRHVYALLYGDLLDGGPSQKILDVGGGLTCLTRLLAATHEYTLVDLLAHDENVISEDFAIAGKSDFLRKVDWFSYDATGAYDIVIANDLFPNVDQRLDLFLERYLQRCKEVRLSLTYYPEPRFYMTKRIGADEIFCMLAWNGLQTRNTLEKYQDRIIDSRLDLLSTPSPSVYPNGRQVCVIALRGDRCEKVQFASANAEG